MEIKSIRKKVTEIFLKYRFVALILLIGIVLMIVPFGAQRDSEEKDTPLEVAVTEATLEDRLSKILSQIHGAGDVAVLLTKGEGELTVYQTDTDSSTAENNLTQRETTVTITDAQHNQSGLIRQVNPPKYLGAVILCEGADDQTVRLSVTEAVSKATGLGTNRISVLKMK